MSKPTIVEVRTKPGRRVARTAPNGPFIPQDEFVPVELTPYVARLINVHGDVEVKPAKATKTATPPAMPTEAKVDKPEKPAAVSADNKEDS